MATFNVSRRAERGDKPKQLRRKGLIPMSIVDRSHKAHLIQSSLLNFRQALGSTDSHGMIDVQIEGDKGVLKAIIKSVDTDPIAHQILSVTLQEVSVDDTINTQIHVVAKGHIDSTGDANLMLTTVTTELKVRAKVSSIPESVEVDVSKLDLGHHISAGDVKLPDGIELLSSPDTVLFTVSRVAEPVLEAEVPEEPAEEPTPAE